MALTATFTANFASFYDAVDKADAKLKDFGAGADKVGARLTTLSNQFSGVKIVQEATIMAKAVEEIGGVSKLTEKELARLGSTAQEAVAKMKALGMDVPKNLQEIADKTKSANKAGTDWMGTLGKMAGAIGIAFSVDAVVDFVGSVFDAAGAIKDLSDQWGVSTKAVQQWSTAAKASGVDAEKLGKSIQFMTGQLTEGSKEYEALLTNMGLSGDTLRGMGTEDAFREMVKAIAAVEDETLQLDLAISAFGPNAKQIIGAIRDGFLDTADAAAYMGDETIRRLDEAGAAWERLKNNVTIYTGEMIARVMETTSNMTKSWGNFFSYLGAAFKGQFVTKDFIGDLNAAAQAQDDLARATQGTAAATTAANTTGRTNQGTLKTTAQVLADVKAKEEALRRAQQERERQLQADQKAQEAYNRAIQSHRDKINGLIDTFEGGDLIGKARDYLEALEQSIPIQQMTARVQDEIHKVMEAAIGVYRAAGVAAPAAMEAAWLATDRARDSVVDYTNVLRAMNAEWVKSVTGGAFDPTSVGTPVDLTAAPPKPGAFDGIGAGIAGALSSSILKAIQGGGSILQAAGSAVGNYLLDPKQSGIGKAIDAAAKKLPGFLGGAISSAIPVVGSLIGPAVSWLGNKIASIFGKKEHEKLRESFISAAGGMGALETAANKAGVSLDSLMKARNSDAVKKSIEAIEKALGGEKMRAAFITVQGGLDQMIAKANEAGVSVDKLFAARSAEEVTGAIDEINAALKFQDDAMALLQQTVEKYGFTIEELGPAMARQELDKTAQGLYQDWQVLNSAGIETVAITDKMSKAVSQYVQDAKKMGIEIPDSMRPMLEAMAKSGKLLDANGNAITDLEKDGISFSMTMSKGFKDLIAEVKNLTDAIARGLGLAIKDVPDVEVKGKVTWDVPPVPDVSRPTATVTAPTPAPTPERGPDLPDYQHGTNGYLNFGKGTPVMLHGWEAVVPRQDPGSFATVNAPAAMASSGQAMTIYLVQDGRETARVVARYLPDAVKEYKV